MRLFAKIKLIKKPLKQGFFFKDTDYKKANANHWFIII